MSTTKKHTSAEQALVFWEGFESACLTPIEKGLINQTFLINKDGKLAILQKLHSIFLPEVNDNLEAVSNYLKGQKFSVPQIIRTKLGKTHATQEGAVWRMLTFIEGDSYACAKNNLQVASAGKLVAQFHSKMSAYPAKLKPNRSKSFSMNDRIVQLKIALNEGVKKPFYQDANRISDSAIAAFEPVAPVVHKRLCHGDLKISNILFDQNDKAVALIDLDTIGYSLWPFEMGDALRSWCNPNSEDNAKDSCIDLELFETALRGYGEGAHSIPTKMEANWLVWGLKSVVLELTIRFTTDILEASYFSWDAEKYASRAEHNVARASAQWKLYENIVDAEDSLEQIVADVLLA